MSATRRHWTAEVEHGAGPLVRLMIWITLRLGWPVGQALLYPITAYFFFRLPASRLHSRRYLSRVLGRRATTADVWRHFFTYASVVLDRISFLAGRTERYRSELIGLERLEAVIAEGRGCLLFGAHLGSFEALRAFGRSSPVPVKALMYRGNTGALSTLFEALDPAIRREVIEIGAPDAMLRVKESLGRGEIVGILADRAPHSQRFVMADFLGAEAAFPTGPLALAAALDAPVMLFFALRRGNRDYQIVLEEFADRIALERSRREAGLRAWIARFAERLETQCRAYPFNWFNFYDFWEPRPNVDATAKPGSLRPPSPPVVPRGGGRTVAGARSQFASELGTRDR